MDHLKNIKSLYVSALILIEFKDTDSLLRMCNAFLMKTNEF